ncbi:30S ribosome-binding factor RbfA [Ferroacidibacillus organovorans]|uniref:Ribosome-binding factor A n=1 Tax=Ferroacidibacillus organovorans TaxID=1765683 RepID=A0A101XSX5_9BACL|nr:30S ribosome-binding factor RbfA [Ferroacidibacillus organovorans]KUO96982.1 ribosome-binding factor A [Ferroacidibacillus organovorans]
MKIRVERIAIQIQREISEVIRSEIKDPRIGFLTVTGVELSNDMAHAKVYVSVMGTKEERETSLTTLARAAGFLRTEVAHRIRLRTVPELHFILDESIDYGERIGNVLRSIAKDSSPESGGAGAKSDG